VASDSGIQVPFTLAVTEGRQYKIGTVSLPPDAPVTQAEVDKILNSQSATPQAVRLRSVWALVGHRYHSKGNIDCKITPQSAFNDATGTVSYTAMIDPGPVYHLGFVKFDNVSDQVRSLLMHDWTLMPGDAFDESYVSNFIVQARQKDPVLRPMLADVKESYDAKADPETHQVNLVIRLAP